MLSERSRFYAWNLGLPLAIALAIFVVFDLTTLDEMISNWLYYPDHAFTYGHGSFLTSPGKPRSLAQSCRLSGHCSNPGGTTG